MKLDPVSAK